MPTFRHGKGTRVLWDKYELSQYLKSFQTGRQTDMAETTAFLSSVKTYVPGVTGATWSADGMFSGGASEVDEVFNTAMGTGGPYTFTIGVDNGFAVGRRVIGGAAHESSYNVSGSVSDMVQIQLQAQCSSPAGSTAAGMLSGMSLHDLTAETTAGAATFVDFGAADTLGGLFIIHVTANTMNNTYTIAAHSATTSGGAYSLITGATQAVPAATTAAYFLPVAAGVTKNQFVKFVNTTAATGSITFQCSYLKNPG